MDLFLFVFTQFQQFLLGSWASKWLWSGWWLQVKLSQRHASCDHHNEFQEVCEDIFCPVLWLTVLLQKCCTEWRSQCKPPGMNRVAMWRPLVTRKSHGALWLGWPTKEKEKQTHCSNDLNGRGKNNQRRKRIIMGSRTYPPIPNSHWLKVLSFLFSEFCFLLFGTERSPMKNKDLLDFILV